MPNLDDIAGRLVRLPQIFRARPRNTLAALDVYDSLGREALFPAPSELPQLHVRKRWKLPGVLSEDLVFESIYAPLEPGFARHYRRRRRRIHTVYARRIRPRNTANRPRLLYIHGYMQPETPIEEIGLVAAMALQLNVEIVQMQPPYHGRRKPRRSPYHGELYWTADVVRSFEALRQTLVDARTLLRLMQSERPGPVGISGLSLGGSLSAIVTCLEPRVDFSIPIIGHMDMRALLRDAPVLGAMREDLARFGWSHDEFGEFFERIGWGELAPAIPTGRIMLVAAREDRFFSPSDVEKMWRDWRMPEILWYPTSHLGFVPHLWSALGHLRGFIDRLHPTR